MLVALVGLVVALVAQAGAGGSGGSMGYYSIPRPTKQALVTRQAL